ncbi:MAG: aldo/keto reductase [Dehalococcoidia bacterium]
MRTVRLGRTGLKVTPICLGTMTFGRQADQSTAHAIMDRALPAGVTFFDTADVYPQGAGETGTTEEIIGTWLPAHRHDMNPATFAVAWTLANPAVTSAIVGASRAEQLKATLAAADARLDPAALAECDAIAAEMGYAYGPFQR